MGILDRFSGKDVDIVAKSLAAEVAKRYPPALENSPQKKISHNRIAKVLEDIYQKAIEFHQQSKLGVYRKARLGNTFQWELKELGYSKQFVDVATEGLIVYITRKTGEAKETAGK